MAKKIAIYEIIHLDWLLPLCELFDGLDYEVHFFTLSQFKKDLHEALPHCYPKYNWTFLDEKEGNISFFIKAKAFFKSTKFDLILLNSVDSKQVILFSILGCYSGQLVLNLHDVNNFFDFKFSFRIRDLLRLVGKQFLNRKVDAFIVNFVEMKNYILNKKLTNKPVYVLAPVFSKAVPIDVRRRNFSVVVPGSIDVRRRDYELVLESWETLGDKNATLILAGAPKETYGDQILKQARSLRQKGYKLRVFDTEIPEMIFQKIISDASLVLSPLRITTSIHDGIMEQYGLTKTSGNIYDAIRHGKPIIIPVGLRVPKAIESSCRHFSNAAELREILNHLLESRKALAKLSEEAYNNSFLYNFETSRNDLVYFIENIIKIRIKA